MDTKLDSQEEDISIAREFLSRKDLRPSFVIKQTEERLHSLHAEANRSDALLLELEALLASSQASNLRKFSGLESSATLDSYATLGDSPTAVDVHAPDAGTCSSEAASAVNSGATQMVQPIPVAIEDLEQPRACSPPARRAKGSTRRSSVVLFDGSSVFGQESVDGLMPPPFLTASADSALAPTALQATPRISARGHSNMQGRSWREAGPILGNVRWHRTFTDMGNGSFPQPPPPGSATVSSCGRQQASAPSSIVTRRISVNEVASSVPRPPSRSSAFRGAAAPPQLEACGVSSWPSQPGGPAGPAQQQPQGRSLPTSEDGVEGQPPRGEAAERQEARCETATATVAKWAVASGAKPGAKASRGRSGQFMRMLKGFFNPSQETAAAALSAVPVRPPSQDGFSSITSPTAGQARPQAHAATAPTSILGTLSLSGVGEALNRDAQHRGDASHRGEGGAHTEYGWEAAPSGTRRTISVPTSSGRALQPHTHSVPLSTSSHQLLFPSGTGTGVGSPPGAHPLSSPLCAVLTPRPSQSGPLSATRPSTATRASFQSEREGRARAGSRGPMGHRNSAAGCMLPQISVGPLPAHPS